MPDSKQRVRPLSVPEISKEASSFEYDDGIPLKYWLRTADAIQKQAISYMRDGHEQDAYLFFLRHALLVLEKLTKHPEAAAAANNGALASAKQMVNTNLAYMEQLKPTIIRRHKQYEAAVARRKSEREEWEKTHRELPAPASGHRLPAGFGQGAEGMALDAKKTLEAGKNKDLAAKLARRSMKHAGGQRNHTSSSAASDRDDSQALQRDIDNLAHQIIDNARLGNDLYTTRRGSQDPTTKTFTPAAPSYPSVPQKTTYSPWEDSKAVNPQPATSLTPSSSRDLPPPRPFKDRYEFNEPPPRPDKISNSHAPAPARPAKELPLTSSERPSSPISRSGTPGVDPSHYTFTATAHLENGSPLRTIFLPSTLRASFLKIASSNTERNLETCGILCGTLMSNAFFVNNLVIPAQESTSDTCEMTHEESLWSYCDTNNLLILGWIHTHPSQSCFMSSRDLHTHAGFQIQLAESIAIVLAPRQDPSWGIFRLTDPPGKQVIVGCRQTGIFHPHENVEGGIYTDAGRPGHVLEIAMEFSVVDLRDTT